MYALFIIIWANFDIRSKYNIWILVLASTMTTISTIMVGLTYKLSTREVISTLTEGMKAGNITDGGKDIDGD